MNGRIFGHVCTRNEADRYLIDSIEWHAGICDAIHVFDDKSTDGTPTLAEAAGAHVDVRGDRQPSFTDHEGEFRQAAWQSLEKAFRPSYEDWVLCFDADEMYLHPLRDERASLERLVQVARIEGVHSWKLRVDEIYEVDNVGFWRRTDGYWGDISAIRFLQYRGLGHFANRKLGCGSVPTYAVQDPGDARRYPQAIRHYGYALPSDRKDKYERYRGMPGHNPKHIESILGTPELELLEARQDDR